MSAQVYGTKYNPKDPQIRTWSVQRTLDPLVAQVGDNALVTLLPERGLEESIVNAMKVVRGIEKSNFVIEKKKKKRGRKKGDVVLSQRCLRERSGVHRRYSYHRHLGDA